MCIVQGAEALRRPPLCEDDPCVGRGGEPLEVMWLQWREAWFPVGSARGDQCFSAGAVLSPREHWQCMGKQLVSQLGRGQGKLVASSAQRPDTLPNIPRCSEQ